MKHIKQFVLLVLIFSLSSCGNSQEQDLKKLLYDFNWMASTVGNGITFSDKPFLKDNAEGGCGAAGMIDIDRDGKQEFIISACHVPRGIPCVEIFAVRENKLQSIGGFFEARTTPHKLSYYTDEQERILFLQETQANYGGTMDILVATYTDNFQNVPIAGIRSQYEQESTEIYYVFPFNEKIVCTNLFLSGNFGSDLERYVVTKEEYNLKLSHYIDSLTWIEEVGYDYFAQYDLYNNYELTTEIRYDEISLANKAGGFEKFQSEEEFKKTSDMVADALYKNYMS